MSSFVVTGCTPCRVGSYILIVVEDTIGIKKTVFSLKTSLAAENREETVVWLIIIYLHTYTV